MRQKVSIVASVYNEEEVVSRFYEALCAVVPTLGYDAEIIFVDDGSSDGSPRILDELVQADGRVGVIHFSRNFGHEAAMLAGIDLAQGDAVVCMDSDLQNPPSLIPSMLEAYEQGNAVVNMVRQDREDGGWYKRVSSRLFYRLINRLSEFHLEPNASDFFLVSRGVAEVLRRDYRERSRFLRGIVQIVGFAHTTIAYHAPSRPLGESKYSFRKLVVFSFTAIASFSKAPLKLGIYLGLLFGLFSVVLIVYSLVMWIVQRPVGGYTTLIIFLSTFASILLFVLGVIGYYIGFIFDEVKARPIYTIREVVSSDKTVNQ